MTEWTVTEYELQLRWLDQFIFHNTPDLNIRWSDIQEYKYQPDRNFDLLKIKLTDGTVVKLWHNTSTMNDDFERFVSGFEKGFNYTMRKNLEYLMTSNERRPFMRQLLVWF
jgi:hypothetical protein